MSKLILLGGVVFVACFFHFGCSQNDEKAKSTAGGSTTDASRKIQTEDFGLGDKIAFSGVELVFTTMEKANHRSFYEDKQLQMYRLTYTIKNNNDLSNNLIRRPPLK